LLLDLLNKQNVETRRTLQFLNFALGARSPEKKNLFKSKHYLSSEETRLKVASMARKGHNTMYGAKRPLNQSSDPPRAITTDTKGKHKLFTLDRKAQKKFGAAARSS